MMKQKNDQIKEKQLSKESPKLQTNLQVLFKKWKTMYLTSADNE